MIVAGTSPSVSIEVGRDEPGMSLQRLVDRVWVYYPVDGEMVKSPVKIDQLPPGRYRQVETDAQESQGKRERSGKLVQTA